MALNTVADYLTSARVLLQDSVADTSGNYRYSDAELVTALNLGILEARKLRPDLFIGSFSSIPSYSAASTGTSVAFDVQYRAPLLLYIVGFAQLRDEEDTTDARSAALLSAFTTKLTGAV